MYRVILMILVLGLAIGCSRSNSEGNGGGTSSDGRGGYSQGAVKEKGGSSAAQIAEDFIAETYKGMYEILSVKEQSTTFRSNPATAVYLQWKIKGDNETQNMLYLVQDGRVRRQETYDTNKSMDENVAVLLKD